MTTQSIKVPFLLSWCDKSDARAIPQLSNATRGVRPGRGEAGWTVYTFRSLDDAHAWAAKNQPSAMPAWKRADVWGGRELGR